MHPPSEPLSIGYTLGQLAIVFALVLANGFFVASEFALVAVRKTRIDQLAAEGSGTARVVQRAVRDLDRYIAATQVGITIASLLLGSLGEKALEPLLEPLFAFLPHGTRGLTSGGVAFAFAFFIMTSLHVIIGELMPKTVALQFPERTSLLIGRPMTFVARLFTPLIWLLNGIGMFLLRAMGIRQTGEHAQVHSPEEIQLIVEESHQGGEINKTEAEIMRRVVHFSDTTAREVMVPRVEMNALPLEVSRADLLRYIRGERQSHTRTPVYHGTPDEIVGIVHLKDLVRFESELPEPSGNGHLDARINLMPLVRETARVPETMTIDRLLLEFKRRRQQMAIVIDEFGGTAGIVTMGDLLDQVFGDTPDEFDGPLPTVKARPDGRLDVPGRELIDEFNTEYGVGFPTDQADTLAGLVLDELGRPAQVGDEVLINDVHIRVEAVDRLRITQLSVLLPATALQDDD